MISSGLPDREPRYRLPINLLSIVTRDQGPQCFFLHTAPDETYAVITEGDVEAGSKKTTEFGKRLVRAISQILWLSPGNRIACLDNEEGVGRADRKSTR